MVKKEAQRKEWGRKGIQKRNRQGGEMGEREDSANRNGDRKKKWKRKRNGNAWFP